MRKLSILALLVAVFGFGQAFAESVKDRVKAINARSSGEMKPEEVPCPTKNSRRGTVVKERVRQIEDKIKDGKATGVEGK
ncbi:MAG: hypothetical protein HYX41_03340 [Bdellovibrio sp.]|nr:hypothetical protein [Bdellovibrio sp.]